MSTSLKTKKLTADVAYDLWVSLHPLRYKVDEKFVKDHTLASPNLSKQTSINAAIERYTRNRAITTSSWLLLSADTLVNKAASAPKRASVHAGNQQMIVEVSVTRRTVRIERLTLQKDIQRYENVKVMVGDEPHYLNCSSEEKVIKLRVVGPWNPVTGEVTLYHYAEAQGALPAHAMLDKYLVWYVNAENQPTSPHATK